MVNYLNDEQQVVDYWYTLDFLSQSNFPHTKPVVKPSDASKTVRYTISISPEKNFLDEINKLIKISNMKYCSSISVTAGCVSRELCIQHIVKTLNISDEMRPSLVERDNSNIALFSIELYSNGENNVESFSLSPIVWATRQLKSSKPEEIAGMLKEDKYIECLTFIQNDLFEKCKSEDENEDLSFEYKQEKSDEDSSNDKDKLEIKDIGFSHTKKLLDCLKKEYINPLLEDIGTTVDKSDFTFQEEYIIEIHFYKDAQTMENDDVFYQPLYQSYYAEDLKLIQNLLSEEATKKKSSNSTSNIQTIKDYINAPTLNEELAKSRVDLIKQTNANEYQENLRSLLHVKNSPLGKWPSRYMPALMQQIAINLAINKGEDDIFKKLGNISSVNGPPGTGKTTLLKEIIASNIVERSILLSKYTDIDEAFETHKFKYGTQIDNAYAKYPNRWYSLKNDDINKYGMFVVSNNNGAVENISKELPKSLLSDLKSQSTDELNAKKELENVAALFTPKQPEKDNISMQEKLVEDIYFTNWAQELFDDDNSWGLIAVPLGKKANIKQFYYKALNPIINNKKYNNKPLSTKEKYAKARENFCNQLKKVQEKQQNIGLACDYMEGLQVAHNKLENQSDELIKLRKEIEIKDIELDVKKENLKEKAMFLDNILEKLNNEHKKAKTACEEKLYEQNKLKQEREENLDKALKALKSVSIFDKFIFKEKYNAAKCVADKNNIKAEETEKRIIKLQDELDVKQEKEKKAAQAIDEEKAKQEKIKKELRNNIEALEKNKKEINDKYDKKSKEYDETQGRISKIEKELDELVKANNTAPEFEKGVMLTNDFITELSSDDVEKSAQAHIENPWFTEEYNREREKLFYYALQFNREFVLNSKQCIANLTSLAYYWKLKTNDQNERVTFDEKERCEIVTALFQTLFLLVPVISTTFASVGRMLKDVTEVNSLGTLIVDEAGQASPHMALGSLLRCRKAMVVGDPKQIEPVVTDDLKLLKCAYQNLRLKMYNNKTLSVQGFADELNPFGTYFENDTDEPDWVGTPLLVHRRCISPMFDISNKISYNGLMKQKTAMPKEALEKEFIYDKSQWIDVRGRVEKSNKGKNYFVAKQGEEICKMLEIAFSNNENPSVYIITPFKTVVSGLKTYIKQYCKTNANLGTKINYEYLIDTNNPCIGTVHTFQGKQANEVIFVLGCDDTQECKGAIRWVNKNIVNVAATRAKYRLYLIGDKNAWSNSEHISFSKEIIDNFLKE